MKYMLIISTMYRIPTIIVKNALFTVAGEGRGGILDKMLPPYLIVVK